MSKMEKIGIGIIAVGVIGLTAGIIAMKRGRI